MKSMSRQMLLLASSALLAGSAMAAVSAEEAKQLGGPVLTEWGAERGGNKDGSIPAWTGERVKVPAAYDPKDPGQLPDPFGDKPLFSISAQNMGKYADKLTEGQKAMLQKYPGYRMDIYQTHRTTIYPKYVIDNTLKNATACKAVNAGLKLEGCYGGVPFPIPKTGNEAVWNHILGLNTPAMHGKVRAWVVDANGNRILQGVNNVVWHFPYWDEEPGGVRDPKSLYWMLRFDTEAPARRAGEKYVILNALDPINPGQRAYVYVPGQRRVKLAPDLAYDTPSPVSGGASTMDEQQGFLGAQDRYNMKLVGKKEAYLWVNSNKMADYKACPEEVQFTKNFVNPDCVRWELRRTWVVEATLKPGYRHILPRRTLYFDEDNAGDVAGDMYDASGKLYRVDYVPAFLVYVGDRQWTNYQDTVTYDLQTGIYSHSSDKAFKGGGYVADKVAKPDTYFSPDAMAGEGIR